LTKVNVNCTFLNFCGQKYASYPFPNGILKALQLTRNSIIFSCDLELIEPISFSIFYIVCILNSNNRPLKGWALNRGNTAFSPVKITRINKIQIRKEGEKYCKEKKVWISRLIFYAEKKEVNVSEKHFKYLFYSLSLVQSTNSYFFNINPQGQIENKNLIES